MAFNAIAARVCPAGMYYTECASKCPKTCGSLYSIIPRDCLDECYPGCQCLQGTFLNHGQCVAASECPCVFQQKDHPPGTVVRISCNDWSVKI